VRYRLALVLIAIAGLGLVGSVVFPSAPPDDGMTPGDGLLLQPVGDGNAIWPYTSRSRSVHGRTLAINVVVVGDEDRVRRALTRRSDANWTDVEAEDAPIEDEAAAADGQAVEEDVSVGESPWGRARGSNRYTYLTGQTVSGFWMDAEYQLATGDYLGRRTHIRAYPSPSGNWTAFQAHVEYWDWFRLRHVVTDVPSGARFVERDLRDEPFVSEVTREYHGFTGGGSDGWLTVIRFASVTSAASVLGLVGAAIPMGRLRRTHLSEALVPVAAVGIVLGVRSAGIALEGLAPGVNPKVFAAFLYPVLAVGPLIAVRALAPGCQPARVALLAGVGLGAGIVLDLLGTGVNTIHIRVALHRLGLSAALAVVALGVARDDRPTAAVGVVAWSLLLAAPLLSFV